MSRSGYSDDCDDGLGLYRGAVASAIRGARGQKFLRDLLDALDKLPEPKLIGGELVDVDGAVCALGAVGKARGINMVGLDPENSNKVAAAFGIADSLACEITYMNDEAPCWNETPEERFIRMRRWVASEIKAE